MKKLSTIIITILAVSLFLSTNLPAKQRAIRVKTRTVDGSTKEIQLYSGYHALVVGCGDYRAGWPKLPNPVKDAREVSSALTGLGWTVDLLEDPDWERLNTALNRLIIGPGREFITAGRETEQVPDRSVFKTCFIQGVKEGYADLNRDGYVTGEELGPYLQEKVVNYSHKAQQSQFDKINNPKLDKGDFIFELNKTQITKLSQSSFTPEAARKRLAKERARIEKERKRLAEEKWLLEEERRLAEKRRRLETELKKVKDEKSKISQLDRRYHVVRSGDTLYHIARKYNISLAEIRSINNLGPDFFLYVGQKLLVVKLDKGELEAERKRLKAEKQKLEMAKLSPTPSLKEIARDGRFIAYDNGTVLDTKTGLMWAAKDNGRNINWLDAKKYCENYRGGGYSDWRMPTVDELASLFNENKSYQAKPSSYIVHLTELIQLTTRFPWASETRGSWAAYFHFLLGYKSWVLQSYSGNYRALPVRSGN